MTATPTPQTSSLTETTGEPLCGPSFSQVAPDRRGRSYVLTSRLNWSADARLAEQVPRAKMVAEACGSAGCETLISDTSSERPARRLAAGSDAVAERPPSILQQLSLPSDSAPSSATLTTCGRGPLAKQPASAGRLRLAGTRAVRSTAAIGGWLELGVADQAATPAGAGPARPARWRSPRPVGYDRRSGRRRPSVGRREAAAPR
jgi:hypothetical protein